MSSEQGQGTPAKPSSVSGDFATRQREPTRGIALLYFDESLDPIQSDIPWPPPNDMKMRMRRNTRMIDPMTKRPMPGQLETFTLVPSIILPAEQLAIYRPIEYMQEKHRLPLTLTEELMTPPPEAFAVPTETQADALGGTQAGPPPSAPFLRRLDGADGSDSNQN